MFEQATKKADLNGGLSEIAVGTSGELFTRNRDGKITSISMDDYQKKRDKYKLLTVSELLNARQYEDQLAFDSRAFQVAENSVGINKIHEHIKDVITSLGSEESSSESYRNKSQLIRELGVKNPTSNQMKGLKELAAIGDAPDGLYKISEKIKTERGHMNEAINYILGTLGKNEQDKLRASVIINGGDATSIKSILQSAFTFGTDDARDIKVEDASNITGSSGTSSEKVGNLTPFEIFHGGKAGTTQIS